MQKLYVDKTFLFIDDEPSTCSAVKRMARIFGVNVQTANSALSAISMIEHDPDQFFLILTDEIMPGMSGSDLLIEVRERWPHIKRGLISGVDNPDVLEKGYQEADIFRYLHKPVSEIEIRNLIEDACEDLLTQKIPLNDLVNNRTSILRAQIDSHLTRVLNKNTFKSFHITYLADCKKAWRQAELYKTHQGGGDSQVFSNKLSLRIKESIDKICSRMVTNSRTPKVDAKMEFKLSKSLRQFGIKGLRRADRYIKGDERLFVAMFATLKDYYVVIGHEMNAMVHPEEEFITILLGGRFTYNDLYNPMLENVEQGIELACLQLEFMMLSILFGSKSVLEFDEKISLKLNV